MGCKLAVECVNKGMMGSHGSLTPSQHSNFQLWEFKQERMCVCQSEVYKVCNEWFDRLKTSVILFCRFPLSQVILECYLCNIEGTTVLCFSNSNTVDHNCSVLPLSEHGYHYFKHSSNIGNIQFFVGTLSPKKKEEKRQLVCVYVTKMEN